MPADKLKKADKIVEVATTQAKEALAFWATLEVGNRRKRLINSINNTRAAHSWNVIARALVNETVLVLMRLLDRHGSDRQSLQTLTALTSSRQVRALIGKRAFAGWVGDTEERKKRNAQTARKYVRTASRRLKRLLASREYQSLRRHRDDHLAHILDRGAAPDPAKYGYVNKVVHRTCRIVQHYRVALLGDWWTPDDDEDVWRDFSRDFYNRLETGSIAKNQARKKEFEELFRGAGQR